MSSPYHAGSRTLQDRFDTRRLADRLDEKFLSSPVIDDGDRAFIERMDMFFLATADADGRPQCSYKGGDPGFVRVLDEHTVAFPNYDGNGMYLSMGNCSRTRTSECCSSTSSPPRPSRLRLNGVASDRRGRRADRRVRRRPVRRSRPRNPGISRTARATSTAWRSSSARASCRTPTGADARPGLETDRVGVRRAAAERPGAGVKAAARRPRVPTRER